MTVNPPDGCRFTHDHEWVRWDGQQLWVGISHYGQRVLGSVTFVALPPLGTRVIAGQPVAEVESTKTVSSVLAPVAGTVVAVNSTVSAEPQRINSDPYGTWLMVLEGDDPSGLDKLMDLAGYSAYLETLTG